MFVLSKLANPNLDDLYRRGNHCTTTVLSLHDPRKHPPGSWSSLPGSVGSQSSTRQHKRSLLFPTSFNNRITTIPPLQQLAILDITTRRPCFSPISFWFRHQSSV